MWEGQGEGKGRDKGEGQNERMNAYPVFVVQTGLPHSTITQRRTCVR